MTILRSLICTCLLLFCSSSGFSQETNGEPPVTLTATLTLEKAGVGHVEVTPPGTVFPIGQVVELTVVPDLPSVGTNTVAAPPSAFAGWSGDVPERWTQTIQVTMDRDKRVTANFQAVVAWMAPGGDAPAFGLNHIISISAATDTLYSYSPDGALQYNESNVAAGIVAADPVSSFRQAFFTDGTNGRAVNLAPDVSARWSKPVPSERRGQSVVGPDRVYFASDDGTYAFDRNGNFQWKSPLRGRLLIDSAGRLYAQGEGKLTCFRRDGQVQAQWNGIKDCWPAVDDEDRVWVFRDFEYGPRLVTLSAFGSSDMTAILPKPGQGSIVIGPGNWRFAGTETGFTAIGPFLNIAWTHPVKAHYSALGSDMVIYVASERGLEALDAYTGEPQWIIFGSGFLNYAPTLGGGLLAATRAVERDGLMHEEMLVISGTAPPPSTGWPQRHGRAGNSGFAGNITAAVPQLADVPVQRGTQGEQRSIGLRMANDDFEPGEVGISVKAGPPGLAISGKTLTFTIGGNWNISVKAFLLADPSRFSITEVQLQMTDDPAVPTARRIQPIQVLAGETVRITNVFAIPFRAGPTNDVMNFTFLEAPDGVSMDDNKAFSWTPTLEQAGREYAIRVKGTRLTVPELSATNEFWITVLAPGAPRPDMEVLVLRVDFPDQPGHPLSREQAIELFMDASGIAPYFRDSSYGAINLNVNAARVPEVVRLAQEAGSYRVGLGARLLEDTRLAAAAAGYPFEKYYRVVVVTPEMNFGFDWKSERWDQTTIIYNHYTFPVVAKELARTYGFEAASSWTPTSDGSGVLVEDGDQYDLLGAGAEARGDLNPRMKHWAGWLPDASVQTISTSGVYRVYQFDDPNAPVGQAEKPLVLKVGKDTSADYWVTFRDNIPSVGVQGLRALSMSATASAAEDGASVLLGQKTKPETLLVNVNGGAAADPLLKVGTSYNDPSAQVKLSVLGVGGVTPERYLDVQVTVGGSEEFTAVLTSRVVNSELILSWPNTSGGEVLVEAASTLDGPWEELATAPIVGDEATLKTDLGGQQRFFRLKRRP